jgi:hypothetical protein
MTYPTDNSQDYDNWEFKEHEHVFIPSPIEGAFSGGIEYVLYYCTQCEERKFVPIGG